MPTFVSPAPSPVSRFRYHARHRGLALALQLGVSLWHHLLAPDGKRPTRSELRSTRKRFLELLQRDVQNVDDGIYPEELLHQFPLSEYMRFIPEAARELLQVRQRKRKRRSRDVPSGVNSDDYPRYYLQNFHWQTDGWLSDESARLYDVGVEFLFLGTADIMRRMAIRPLVEGLDPHNDSPRILDIACGTGRFIQQIRRTLPHASIVGLDLSPNYVSFARQLMAGDEKTDVVRGNAESLPFEDASFDCVSSVFLFHELPKDARRRVMREAFRVLKPGGRFTVCDSAQLRGNDEIASALKRFPVMYHEPFYKGYLKDDLDVIMSDVGFGSPRTETHLVSQVASAYRPALSDRSS